jgi:methylmalonyl-CoA mutase N-terminal domain/subunit
MLAFLVVGAERLGYDAHQFRVMLQNDSLKEYVARGTFIFPPQRGLEFSVDVIEYCARELRNWEPIEFCGYHIRDSGANAVQEIAMAMSNAIEYIDATLRRGLAIDDFAHTLYMFLSAHIDLFEEIAKFRATRTLWAELMRDRFGATSEDSWKLNIFVYTLGSQLTRQEPLNNIARVAFESLAAVLGGVQTIATSSFDEALGLPTDEAVRVALRTQQILAFETGVTRVTDPLGGSYYIERLTSDFADEVRTYLAKIAERGGGLRALESGWIASEIDESAYQLQRSIDNGERVLVGVNRFREEQASGVRSVPVASREVEEDQIARIENLRRTRDPAAVSSSLERVRTDATSARNMVPALIEAVRAEATIGEMCGVLKTAWGGYKQTW